MPISHICHGRSALISTPTVSKRIMHITRNQLRQIIREALESDQPSEDFLTALSGNDYRIDSIVSNSLRKFDTKETKIFEDFDHWTRRAANKIRKMASSEEEAAEMQMIALRYLIEKIREKAALDLPGLRGKLERAKNVRLLAEIIRGLFFNSQYGLTGPLNNLESRKLKRLIIRNMSAVKQ